MLLIIVIIDNNYFYFIGPQYWVMSPCSLQMSSCSLEQPMSVVYSFGEKCQKLDLPATDYIQQVPKIQWIQQIPWIQCIQQIQWIHYIRHGTLNVIRLNHNNNLLQLTQIYLSILLNGFSEFDAARNIREKQQQQAITCSLSLSLAPESYLETFTQSFFFSFASCCWLLAFGFNLNFDFN